MWSVVKMQSIHQWRQKLDPFYFVDLGNDRVQDFTFERPEDDSFVLDRVDHVASAWLDGASSDLVDRCYGNDKSIPEELKALRFNTRSIARADSSSKFLLARTRSLNLAEELLMDSLDEIGTKVSGMKQDLVFERNLERLNK